MPAEKIFILYSAQKSEYIPVWTAPANIKSPVSDLGTRTPESILSIRFPVYALLVGSSNFA